MNFSNDFSACSTSNELPQSYDSNSVGNFRRNCFSAMLKFVSSFGNTNSPHCGHVNPFAASIDNVEMNTIWKSKTFNHIPKRQKKIIHTKTTLIRVSDAMLSFDLFFYLLRYCLFPDQIRRSTKPFKITILKLIHICKILHESPRCWFWTISTLEK